MWRGVRQVLVGCLVPLVAMGWAVDVWGQSTDKAALQKERDRIELQLKTTENLLKQAKSNRDDAAQQVSLLNKKIELREKLVRHHQATIRSLERSMRGTDTELRTLEGHVSALKDEYARMVQQAYRMKLGANPLLFIFAADDFSQAALRFRLVQSYTSVRKQQVEQIEETQIELAEVRVTLNEERAAVETALAEQQAERDALRADRGERTALVDQLQAEEKRLRRAQKAQEKERQRLNDEIKRIIEAELAAERASAAGEFALTPAGKIVSEAFEKNQRTLPWPVMRGVVTQGFGRQPHPTLSGITIENNGIDITTEAGNRVLSIFQGTVSSVFNLPGAGTSVIVTHGAYRTVYTNLANCPVKKGQTVDVGTFLGNVGGAEGANSVLHFEVWKVAGSERQPVDPRQWLTAK
jgi:septal ring factor EnvC (AmiA/AmiB activator)